MAYKFKNNTGRHKFNGEFTLNGIVYEYFLYLPDFNTSERDELVNLFGKRMQKDKVCLDVTEDIVMGYIDNNQVSAYIIINQQGSDETASGTLQIYDHCSGNKKQLLSNAFVWINDVCRILGPSGIKTQVSPIGALFAFMEQLTVQNMKKNDICLFVDTHDENNKNVLTDIYKNKYGFINNSLEDVGLCPNNSTGSDLMVMQKPGLVSDPTMIDFSFLMKRTSGGRKKTKKQKKYKNKTLKPHLKK